MIREFERLGFGVRFYHARPRLETEADDCICILRDPDGRVAASVVWMDTPAGDLLIYSCGSWVPGGRSLTTTSRPRLFAVPPRHDYLYLPGQPVETMVARHKEWVSQMDRQGSPAVRLDDAALAALVLQEEQDHVDYQARRSVFAPLTPDEVERLRATRRVGRTPA